MAGRILLLVACAAALAFLGFGLRQSDLERRGREAVLPQRSMDAAQAARAQRRLERASRGYPGVEPELLLGILELNRDRPRAARRRLLAVTRREPDNIEAWAWLGNAAVAANDRALLARVREQIRTLRPPVE